MLKIKAKKSYFIIGAIVIVILAGVFLISNHTNAKPKANNSPVKYPSIGNPAPDVTFTTISGKNVKLSDYKGKKVLLWYFATWCPTCQAGAQALEKNNNKIGNLQVIAVKTYGNAGYGGIPTKSFAEKYASTSLSYNNWIWGDASQRASQTYNPKNYPDIYYLINKDGNVVNINGAPGATINNIIYFARGG